MTKLQAWILRKITKVLVRQGPGHKSNITQYYQIMYDAAKNEFSEDNKPTFDSFLDECFYMREQERQNGN